MLKTSNVPILEFPFLSKNDKGFLGLDPKYYHFFPHFPSIDSILEQSRTQEYASFKNRDVLVQVLNKQYNRNINGTFDILLKKNTLAIVCAHQPCLMGGPLFMIYKIATCINLANKLNSIQSEFHYVPIFYIGSEDHDIDEINHFHIFNKRITWQVQTSHAAGRLSTEGLEAVYDEVLSFFERDPSAKSNLEALRSTLVFDENYTSFFRSLVLQIFQNSNLLLIDPDDPDLKSLFSQVIKSEIESAASSKILSETIVKLEHEGIKVQTKGRPCNLFLHTDHGRERIDQLEDGMFRTIISDQVFTKLELLHLLDKSPEAFSPNVVLRPLYQQTILPAPVFIGGGGELSYWMELPNIFKHYLVPYPVVIRRRSAMIIESSIEKRISKIGLTDFDFFQTEDFAVKKYLHHFDSITNMKLGIEKFDEIDKEFYPLINDIDPSMANKWKGILKNWKAELLDFNSKINKLNRQKHETALNQIASIFVKLYPQSGLQERYDSSIAFFAQYGEEGIGKLIEEMNPLDNSMLIIKPS